MEDKDRPVGRKKRFGVGSGDVAKRGEGLSGRTEGPVGEASGYANRQEGQEGPAERPAARPTSEQPSSARPAADYGTGGERAPGLEDLDTGSYGSGEGPAGGAGGQGRAPAGTGTSALGCSPRILLTLLLIALIALALFFLFRSCGGNDQSGNNGLEGGGATSTVTQPDTQAPAVDQSVSAQARAKRTVLKGGGADIATVMIYMCGTDLESRGGMATSDLQEMLNAQLSDKVNVIVETGGAAQWRNNVVSNNSNQRYRVTSQGLEPLEQNLGKRSMVDPATLADFIRYCKEKYPADRYELIFWDHGAGSLAGYGYDELFPRDSMTLGEISTALKNGGATFDFIGFDACLMATLETALVLEPHADYMISSEETEPGRGWYYTNWLSELAANPSQPTTDLGKRIIDDYVRDVQINEPQSQATLSLIDLAELSGTVPPSFTSFAQSTSGLIQADQYRTVSDARAGTKEFSKASRSNQIDLIDFTQKLGTSEARNFAQVLRSCIKYNRTTPNISNANGVSIFFPSGRLAQLDSMLQTYDEIGITSEYSNCLRSYANLTAGGQMVSEGSGNMLEMLLAGLSGGQAPSGPGLQGAQALGTLLEAFLSRGDFSSITGAADRSPTWLDPAQMRSALPFYADNQFDASALKLTQKNGQQVLALSEEQWKEVQTLEQNVFLDDGDGFIDLGLDNIFEYNDDGDLVMEYDGTWLALNGQVVAYYLVSEDQTEEGSIIMGRVPALLNDQLVDIVVTFSDQNPDGAVLGARLKYELEDQIETIPKGLLPIVAGDKIDFLCDYYTYDGAYDDTFFLGEQYTATGEWTVENVPVGDMPYQMTYRLTDIYGNRYWTPPVTDQ